MFVIATSVRVQQLLDDVVSSGSSLVYEAGTKPVAQARALLGECPPPEALEVLENNCSDIGRLRLTAAGVVLIAVVAELRHESSLYAPVSSAGAARPSETVINRWNVNLALVCGESLLEVLSTIKLSAAEGTTLYSPFHLAHQALSKALDAPETKAAYYLTPEDLASLKRCADASDFDVAKGAKQNRIVAKSKMRLAETTTQVLEFFF